MKKITALLLVIIMMMGMFTACGKNKDEDANSMTQSEFVNSIIVEAQSNAATSSNASKPEGDNSNPSSSDKNSASQSSGSAASSGVASNGTATSSKPSDSSSSKPSGSSSSKPSGTTSSKPAGTTGTTPKMPSGLKNLKGIEKLQKEPVDYSNSSNWISKPSATKDVDVFFLYPTGYNGGSGLDEISDIDDAGMLSLANMSKMAQASVFQQSCNVYMPKYRQLSVSAMLKYRAEENMIYCASFDIYSALDYYFKNINNGRPFILAGHSQGSVWLSVILQDYMKKHPEYLKRMVAAYVIGYSITKDYLKKNTHLKFAKGATDTGVIISYNTEGVGNKNQTNIVVEKGSVAINPINWKTDGTKASVSENLGSLDYATGTLGKGIADAKVDTERGVVICTTVDKSMATAGFGPESYHMHDYSFYYGNLVKNVADRIAAYKKNK